MTFSFKESGLNDKNIKQNKDLLRVAAEGLYFVI